MCGIAAIFHVLPTSAGSEAPSPGALCAAIEPALLHRGPDGRGEHTSVVPGGRVVLVHRRLAIIDPAGGAQPMHAAPTPDHPGVLSVVFNGCIYNHRALRTELAARHRFATHHSDTEVLLHAYRQWGEGFTDHLDGMFALALWDERAGSLVLARDRMGEKPLYWALTPDAKLLVAASTVPALLAGARACGWADAASVHPPALANWLRLGWWSQPPFVHVRELRPGEGLTFSLRDGALHVRARAPRPFPPRAPVATAALADDALERAIKASVADRLDADVPVACFLSGGVDSPLLASLARELRPDLRCVTVQMPDAQLDEAPRAQAIARALGLRHEVLACPPAHIADDLSLLLGQLGLPFSDSSLLPTTWLSRAVRAHAGVALAGDGGDELFLGYDRYRAARWLATLRPLLALLPPIDGALPAMGGPASARSARARAARLGRAARGLGYDDLLAIFPSQLFGQLLPDAAPSAPLDPAASDPARLDAATYLPFDLLRKTDTASMSVALEVRAPLLAWPIVATAMAAPRAALAPRGMPKAPLRRLLARRLPAHLLPARKQGFAIPLGQWMRTNFAGLGDLTRQTLGDPRAFPADLLPIHHPTLLRLLDEHMQGRRDHAQRLYALLVMALWLRGRR